MLYVGVTCLVDGPVFPRVSGIANQELYVWLGRRPCQVLNIRVSRKANVVYVKVGW